MKTRSQELAHKIHDQVRGLFDDVDKLAQDAIPERRPQLRTLLKHYDALCQRLPMLIYRNGLAQTLSYLAAKATFGDQLGQDADKTNAHGCLITHLAAVLPFEHGAESGSDREQAQRLVAAVLDADMTKYRRFVRMALEACEWYRRFSAPPEEGGDKAAGTEAPNAGGVKEEST